MNLVTRRILGFAVAILVVALGYVGVDTVLSPSAGSYQVTVILGQAGSGIGSGSDVKARGVVVGEVDDVRLEDGHAVATLTMFPEHRLPGPERVAAVVTSKTFLGAKQVELRLDGPVESPYLAAGDLLRVREGQPPREVQDLFAKFEEFLGAVDPGDVAAIIEAFGSFDQQDAEIAGRNIDLAGELSDFGARTADAQLDRISTLADIVETLAPRAEDLNRLNRTIPDWVSVLPDHQADVRANLEALSSFSIGFAEFLEVNETALSQLIRVGDQVGAVLEPRAHEIGRLIHGIYRYGHNFGYHGGELSDGSEHAWFRIISGNEGQFEEFCEELPEELQEAAPGCVADGEGGDAP